MKVFSKLPLVLTIVTLVLIVALSSGKSAPKQVRQTSAKPVRPQEIRGLWVSYMDLDMSGTDRSFSAFKKKFNHIADTAKKDKFNTLIVQVRPFSDALYNSSYFPYSHILTGTQGKNPGYDPLEYMCSYCKKQKLGIHAWINPYRVRNTEDLILSENNPYNNNKSLGTKVGKGIYYNPANKNVRKLIENGIKEIIRNYDVDGIQFDDYFYPTKSKKFDSAEYNLYKNNYKNALSLKAWRIANVNTLIAECYGLIHNIKKDAVFGISPQGNIDNDYGMYADVKSWCSKYGYIDYICPQLYYSLKNPALKFETALNNWTSLDYSQSVKLYIGLAGYKTGTDSDSGTWNYSDNIIQQEVALIRKKKLSGFMLYSFANLESKKAAKEVANLIKILD